MSGTRGLFSKRIKLQSYYDNASGLREGAPVRLSGVDVGNVIKIRVVPDKDKQLTAVEVIMKGSTKYGFDLRRDSVISLETAGVLGETYVDIDSSQSVDALREELAKHSQLQSRGRHSAVWRYPHHSGAP